MHSGAARRGALCGGVLGAGLGMQQARAMVPRRARAAALLLAAVALAALALRAGGTAGTPAGRVLRPLYFPSRDGRLTNNYESTKVALALAALSGRALELPHLGQELLPFGALFDAAQAARCNAFAAVDSATPHSNASGPLWIITPSMADGFKPFLDKRGGCWEGAGGAASVCGLHAEAAVPNGALPPGAAPGALLEYREDNEAPASTNPAYATMLARRLRDAPERVAHAGLLYMSVGMFGFNGLQWRRGALVSPRLSACFRPVDIIERAGLAAVGMLRESSPAPRGAFLAIHARRTDFKRFCTFPQWNVWPYEACFPPAAKVARLVAEISREWGGAPVYVLTESEDFVAELREAEGGLARGAVRAAADTFTAEALASLQGDQLALAEKVVGAHAALFVRHPGSSFSSHVGDMRDAFYREAAAGAITIDLGETLVQRGIVKPKSAEEVPPLPPPKQVAVQQRPPLAE